MQINSYFVGQENDKIKILIELLDKEGSNLSTFYYELVLRIKGGKLNRKYYEIDSITDEEESSDDDLLSLLLSGFLTLACHAGDPLLLVDPCLLLFLSLLKISLLDSRHYEGVEIRSFEH